MLRLGAGGWENGKSGAECVRILFNYSPPDVQMKVRSLSVHGPFPGSLDPEITFSHE